MLAIDTNVVIRYLTGDDPEQSGKARRIVEANDVFVATTVLLETDWALRSVYDFTTPDVVSALTAFAGLPRVKLEDPSAIARALAWTEAGMDFADALHLTKAEGCSAFVTFDKRFAGRAAALAGLKVAVP